ncbi:hypothetical protein I4U23_022544 [Adineta vaga]|nr:hypothetical protein I4U23_022544 [Adineta vaga]
MAAPKSFSTVDVNIAQVILEVVIILVTVLEPVQSAYMRRYIKVLVGALLLETTLIAAYAYMLHAMLDAVLAMILWEIYKLVRLFVSLAFIIIVGTVVNYMKSISGTPSGFNNVAFMLIFVFTLQQ